MLTGIDTTHILLDESGNGTIESPLLVAATVIPDIERTEEAIRKRYEWIRESRRFEGLRSFDTFIAEGFHHATNPREIQELFIDFLEKLPGHRTFIAASTGARLPELTERRRALVLYGTILPDVIISTTTPKVHLAFEVNDDLRKSFSKLVDDSVQRAKLRAQRRSIPEITFSTVKKHEFRSMGVTDYVLALVSFWIQNGLTTDPASFAFRNYRTVRENIALIYDFDRDLRSDRANRSFH